MENAQAFYQRILEKTIEKAALNIERFQGQFPLVGNGNTYILTGNTSWVSGYWTAWLWMMYYCTGENKFRDAADKHYGSYRDRFYTDRAHSIYTNDIGAVYDMGAVRGYQLTGDVKWRNLALRAAAVLSVRFNDKGKFLRAWGLPGETNENTGRTIIDSLCCTPLWIWAAVQTDDPVYIGLVKAQTDTVLKYLIREDGSTGHSFLFNPATGEPLGVSTVQGREDDSTWSRGQAWGIHGFALAYEATGDDAYRGASMKLTKWFNDHLPDTLIPPWDFSRPEEERDTSALTLAVNGMLRLAAARSTPARDAEWLTALAGDYMQALIRLHSTFDEPEAQGLLREGMYNKPNNQGISQFTIWGDYYFVENLLILAGKDPLKLERYRW